MWKGIIKKYAGKCKLRVVKIKNPDVYIMMGLEKLF